MASSKSSKMLPIITLVVVAIVGAGLYVNFFIFDDNGSGKSDLSFKSKRKNKVQIDADLPADTLKTLAEKSATFQSQVKGVEETTNQSSREIREMKKMMQEMVKTNTALREQLDKQNRKMTAVESAVTTSNSKTVDFEALKESVVEAVTGNITKLMPEETQTEYPISPSELPDQPAIEPETTSRVRSYGVPVDKNGQVPQTYLEQLDQTSNDADVRGPAAVQSPQQVIVDPRYTIPADSVLNDSVTVTALIGRIPKNGSIGDPAPFKVAIGKENLTANGFTIPGIDRMIMSGVVYGDSVRSCVITKLRRATYIFEDGRILTLPRSKSSNRGQGSSTGITSGGSIGYLTDPYGDPCIKGKLYSNGNTQLLKQIAADSAAGAANAYAQTQVTNLTTAANAVTSAVTGSDSKFVTGTAVAAGIQSAADAIKAQEFDSWDQVVVSVGTTVSIHMDQQLEIDNASNLRKLVYGQENNFNGLTD